MLLPDEWRWLRSSTPHVEPRYGMAGSERVLLYALAIQTGLRSAELRSLTRGRLFLDAHEPFITCKAGSTKNSKDARQYIQRDLADELQNHIATKAPQAPVFSMPKPFDVADMLRADLGDARQAWLRAAEHDPDEHQRRLQSDFLADVNHDGEVLDFQSLRHCTGAWLAMAGAHPKAVQTVMRHSSIVLTMDTYGHLFPGQEAETVAGFPGMMGDGTGFLRATGTTDTTAQNDPRHLSQQLERETMRAGARPCLDVAPDPAAGTLRQTPINAEANDSVRSGATAKRYWAAQGSNL